MELATIMRLRRKLVATFKKGEQPMDYITRAIEPILQHSGQTFKAVLITGPRQVGKSTILRETFKNIAEITFDDKIQLKNS